MARSLVVIHPVIDLRSSPGIVFPKDYSHQDGRETQLLLGENLLFIEEREEWLRVGTLEQLHYTTHEGWTPCPGWVHRSEVQEAPPARYTHVVSAPGTLSYGTLVNPLRHDAEGIRPIPKAPDREQMIVEARQFLGAPYLWGGRASPIPHTIASVDCSALVNLLYRAQGIHLPRNAYDQYLTSRPVERLLPADPLYLAKASRINHVILKLDEGNFIEAPETGKTVRLLKWGIDIWEEEGKIRIFDRPHPYTGYPRTFISPLA